MKRNRIAGRSTFIGCSLSLFSDSDLEMIHDATLEVLEYAGLYVQSKEALDIYEDGGCMVDHKSQNVKIPAYIVEEAIDSAPKKVFLAGRDPKHDIVLESGRVNFCPFGEGVMVIDPYTGEYRKSTKKDKGDVARLVDALDQYDMLENTVAPRDVHPEMESLHNYEITVSNTTKHVPQPCHDKRSAQLLIEMAAAVAGGREKLKDRPIVSGCTCPQSPLTISEGCADPIIEYARANLPQNILSMALAGATSPVTLAGTLVTHNAEVLGGIVLAQLTRKGAPVMYGSSTSMIDLKMTTATVGCPELGLISAAVAKLAQMYLLPSYVAGTQGDSKLSDAQSGHEKTLTTLLPALAGANMIYGGGMLEMGLTMSFGQLVMDNEIIAMTRKVLEGIPVNDDTLAVDVIKSVGARGHFLAEDHTFNNMRKLSEPKYIDRRMRQFWMERGSKDLATVCDEKAREILETHKPDPLPDGVHDQLMAIIAAREEELGIRAKN